MKKLIIIIAITLAKFSILYSSDLGHSKINNPIKTHYLGVSASGLSGGGLCYKLNLFDLVTLKASYGIVPPLIRSNKYLDDHSINSGGELQINILKTDKNRFYALTCFGFVNKDNWEKEIKNAYDFAGFGIGYEFNIYDVVYLNIDAGYIFGDHEFEVYDYSNSILRGESYKVLNRSSNEYRKFAFGLGFGYYF